MKQQDSIIKSIFRIDNKLSIDTTDENSTYDYKLVQDLKPIESLMNKKIENKQEIGLALLIYLLIFMTTLAISKVKIGHLTKIFIISSLRSKKLNELVEKGFYNYIIYFSIVLLCSFLTLILFFSELLSFDIVSPESITILSALIIYHFIFSIGIKLFGKIFNENPLFSTLQINNWVYHTMLGLLIAPFAIIAVFSPEIIKHPFIYCSFSIIGVLYISKIYRCLKILLNYNVSIFYIILYLCTLEILPIAIIIKGI